MGNVPSPETKRQQWRLAPPPTDTDRRDAKAPQCARAKLGTAELGVTSLETPGLSRPSALAPALKPAATAWVLSSQKPWIHYGAHILLHTFLVTQPITRAPQPHHWDHTYCRPLLSYAHLDAFSLGQLPMVPAVHDRWFPGTVPREPVLSTELDTAVAHLDDRPGMVVEGCPNPFIFWGQWGPLEAA